MATKANPTPTASNSITSSGKTIYLTNKELLAEVRRAKLEGKMTTTLAKMLQLLCSKYAKKGSFVNYSYNEDMQAYAMMMLVRTWNNFDSDKYDNPFAFYTQCVKNSFIQFLNQEKRQRHTRDLMMINSGLNPSYGYDGDDERGQGIEDEQEFDTIRATSAILERTRYVDAPIERDDKGHEVVVDLDPDDDVEIVPIQ